MERYNQPNITSTQFLREVMHSPDVSISDRVKAAAALMEIECVAPRSRRKGKRIVEPASVVVKIPDLPSAACARAEERQRANLTLIKGHG